MDLLMDEDENVVLIPLHPLCNRFMRFDLRTKWMSFEIRRENIRFLGISPMMFFSTLNYYLLTGCSKTN